MDLVKNNMAARFILLALITITLAACSSTSSETVYAGNVEVHDPLEEGNRAVLAFNEAVDHAVLAPVARGYRNYTPSAFRLALRNFLRNLKSPIIIANQMLQGDVDGTFNSAGRFVINTLAGFGGILDLAEEGGIRYEPEDFGQTLGVWGVDHGPYLVVPLLGPSTVRDSVGTLVDMYADPLRIYLFNTDQKGWHYARVGASVLDQREELLDVLDDLRNNSFDYYAALRSAYYQRREALKNDQSADHIAGPAIPDYTD